MSRKAHARIRPSLPLLREALNSAESALLDAILNEARATSVELWLVGGAVRDLAIDRPINDLDLAIDGDPAHLARSVAARMPGDVTVEDEPRFGTASLRVEGARVDLARLRSERYVAPGTLPEVTFGADIEADLARRDFTVNAMALGLTGDRTGELVDPFGALDDLTAGRLQVLHDRSFEDDATRLWRGARTAALFDLAPDEATARLIVDGTHWLATISGDRVVAELRATARRGRTSRTLGLADDWGVLRGTHPVLRLDASTARALRRRPGPVPFEVVLGILLAPLPERAAILDRLAAPRAIATVVEQTAQIVGAGVVDDHSPEHLGRLAGATEAARLAARWLDPERQPALQRDLARWERTRAPIDASELMRLGMPRGPELGAALHGLRRARYLGTLRTPAEARREIQRLLDAREPGNDPQQRSG